MKKVIICALYLTMCTLGTYAQNTWEMTESEKLEMAKKQQKKAKQAVVDIDPKYAPGQVPVVDGKVVFETTINAPGKTKKQIMDIIAAYLEEMTNEPNQIDNDNNTKISQVLMNDKEKGTIVARFYEYLVFKNAFLSLDRTDFDFYISADCSDGKAVIKMFRMRYIYEQSRQGGFNSPAEEIITDDFAFNKKKTKLSRMYGKFRKKTIDRKNYIFNQFEQKLK